MQRNNGNLYAGAITYFSFLALFPLLLLAVSITGFVLHSDPGLEHSLFQHLSEKVPGEFGATLRKSIEKAIDNRSGVGIVGLAGVLLTGLGWVGNLRAAIDAVWGRGVQKVNFVKAKVGNLVVLAGLGLGIVVSLGLTAVGTSLTDQILRAIGLDDLPGATFLLKLLGIAIAIAGDLVIFWWLLIRLPAVEVPEGVAWRGALLASVGFEVLKVVGTYTIAHTAQSATAGPFAGIIAVLVWIQLVARWLLFSCAWTATLTAEAAGDMAGASVAGAYRQRGAAAGGAGAAGAGAGGAASPRDDAAGDDAAVAVPAVSPAAVGFGLVGAGAVVGAVGAVTALAARRRTPARRGS
jgi:membrane protein